MPAAAALNEDDLHRLTRFGESVAGIGPIKDELWRARAFTLRSPDDNWIRVSEAIVRGIDDAMGVA